MIGDQYGTFILVGMALALFKFSRCGAPVGVASVVSIVRACTSARNLAKGITYWNVG